MRCNILNIVRPLAILAIFFSASCATYYQKNAEFQEYFASGNLEDAGKFIEQNSKAAEKKDRLLYFMDKGVVHHMLGNYEESNKAFEQAYIFIEDYRNNFARDAFALISNPMSKPYIGEDFEVVMIHYYKTLNYIHLKDYSRALVEVKRINIKLNQLNDRYENKKNRYKQDAFAQILTGIIYEADKDYNNAFISYRNAYETYKEIYLPEFNVPVPEQLKHDLIRSAHLTGFVSEQLYYEKEFGIKYRPTPEKEGAPQLVFFWLNGLGPVKSENSLNFAMVKGKGGVVNFTDEEAGITLPIPVPPSSSDEKTSFGDVKVVRVAFPKYEARMPVKSTAKLIGGDTAKTLETAEDINAIAFSTLQDRMLRELGNSLLRLATKQAAEIAVRQENEELGALLSVANAITEKADTRNWQTLPYSISYSRMQLNEGKNHLKLVTKGVENRKDTVDFNIVAKPGETVFQTFHSMESYPVGVKIP